jgi:hypothetical protein
MPKLNYVTEPFRFAVLLTASTDMLHRPRPHRQALAYVKFQRHS